MKIKYCVTDGCACVVRKMCSLPKSFATPKLLSFLLMSGVDGVSGNCHTFCHQRAAFAVLQWVRRTASVVNLSPKMVISRHAVDILPQFFLRPDSIQVFVFCSRKTGRITSTEIDKKNVLVAALKCQHPKMILEQLWLNFDNHIQLSRTLLYSSGKIKGWSMVLKRKEDIHHKLEGHKCISVFSLFLH